MPHRKNLADVENANPFFYKQLVPPHTNKKEKTKQKKVTLNTAGKQKLDQKVRGRRTR